jgi:hypothetical protein
MKFSAIFVLSSTINPNQFMKPFLSLLAIVFYAVAAKAQIALDDFYKQGSSWCEFESKSIPQLPTLFRYHNYTIGTDSLIGSKTYHLVKYSAHDNYNGQSFNSTILGGIRVSNDSVFFIRTYMFNTNLSNMLEDYFNYSFVLNAESLLYRYNVQPGDYFDFSGVHHDILSVTSVSLSNGQVVDKYEVHSNDPISNFNYSILKGIGSSSSFWGPRLSYVYSRTIFYSNPNFSYSFNSGFGIGNCFPTSVSNLTTNEVFNIYPNPLTDNALHITSIGIEKLNIVDVTGKTVYAVSQLPSGEHTISINLDTGIYILKAQLTDGTTQMRKIVRQ